MPIGMIVDARFAEVLRQKLYALIGTRLDNQYPAAELYPLQNRDLNTLIVHDYLVSAKGTGARALLLITRDGSFFYGKDYKFYYNDVAFPGRGGPHFDTVIDGEIDVDNNSYMCFDLICIDGVRMVERSTSTRLGILLEDIIRMITQPMPFKIEMNRYERSYGLDKILSQDCHELVFTPIKAAYTPKHTRLACKLYIILIRFCWEDPSNACVTFKLKVLWDQNRKAHYQLLVCEGIAHKYFDDFTPTDELYNEWKGQNMDGKIIDCQYDKNHETYLWENGYATTSRMGGWKFVKFRFRYFIRPDKTKAEDDAKIKKKWKSILEPITREMVVKFNKLESSLEDMRLAWKRREKKLSTEKQQNLEEYQQKSQPNVQCKSDPHSENAKISQGLTGKRPAESPRSRGHSSDMEIQSPSMDTNKKLKIISIKEEVYEEEEISCGVIKPQAVLKSPREFVASPTEKYTSIEITFSKRVETKSSFVNIDKDHLLKHENAFIPDLPVAAASVIPNENSTGDLAPENGNIVPTILNNNEDSDESDALDDLYEQRYTQQKAPKGVEFREQEQSQETTEVFQQETSNQISGLTTDADNETSQSKKKAWLDMLLN